jgi:uncharacterized protein YciI
MNLPRAALAFTMLLLMLADTAGSAGAAEAEPAAPATNRQYLYVLHLVPRLHDEAAWTAADQAAVQRHFLRLKQATADGRVIFAGRSDEPNDRTFGLVVFEAASEAEARQFMLEDDAVQAGVMSAELHPFALALQRAR